MAADNTVAVGGRTKSHVPAFVIGTDDETGLLWFKPSIHFKGIPFHAKLFLMQILPEALTDKVLCLDPAGTMRSAGSSTGVVHRNVKAHSDQISGNSFTSS